MQLQIPKLSYNSLPFVDITALLFCACSGFYIKHFSIICPIYLTFYLAFACVIYIACRTRQIALPFSAKLGILTAFYILISQYIVGGRLIVYLASFSTMLCYVFAIIILSKLSNSKIFNICKVMLSFNCILYLIDTLYRLIINNFSFNKIIINYFLPNKLKWSLFFCDSNAIGINGTFLFFLSVYLYDITKEKIYFRFALIYLVIVFLTFSRIAVVALFFGILITKLYDFGKKNLLKRQQVLHIIPICKLISLVILIFTIIASCYLLLAINDYAQNDRSFMTKTKLIEEVGNFLLYADTKHWWLGMGFQTETSMNSFLTRFAHSYLPTYVVESGICGFTLVTSFLLSIAKDTPKCLMLLIPFAIMGFSYIGHTYLNLFYITLGIIYVLERRKC